MDSNITHIEDNIPLPVKRPIKRYGIYPFRKLVPGQSFLVTFDATKHKSFRTFYSTLNSSAHQISKATGMGFMVRTVNEKTAVRVWRVS